MKIKMLTILAGPGGAAQPGQVIDRPEDEAKSLVARGYATFVSPPRAPEKEIVSPETTTAGPAEDASMPKARPRKGGRKP